MTNREALDWAYQCCQTAFPETKPGEWEVKATDAPRTGDLCFIDLVHNSAALDFQFVPAKDRPDAFGPFIRVTNSYNDNGLRALAFDIGFLRKVCKNGLILPKSIIRFKFTHLQRDIGKEINFEVAHERISKLRAGFSEYLGVLRDCRVTPPDFEPLFCGVLLIRKPKDMKPDGPIAIDWVFCLNTWVLSAVDTEMILVKTPMRYSTPLPSSLRTRLRIDASTGIAIVFRGWPVIG